MGFWSATDIDKNWVENEWFKVAQVFINTFIGFSFLMTMYNESMYSQRPKSERSDFGKCQKPNDRLDFGRSVCSNVRFVRTFGFRTDH